MKADNRLAALCLLVLAALLAVLRSRDIGICRLKRGQSAHPLAECLLDLTPERFSAPTTMANQREPERCISVHRGQRLGPSGGERE